MFGFPGTWKIYLAVEPVDMRKHYDGLWAQAEQHLGENPRQGALFVFSNKERNRIKMLYWDGTGGIRPAHDLTQRHCCDVVRHHE